MIGDGMALSQVSAGIYWKGEGKSAFERFPIVGFHDAHSHADLVTDSGAGATAFACGLKSFNGAIGVAAPDTLPCQSIVEKLAALNFATGMVVTCSATHATPASFVAHEDLRAFTEMIALDYLDAPLDCFVGGGAASFFNRPDKLDLKDSLRQRGYIIRKGTSFKNLPLDGSAPFYLFTAEEEPESSDAGRRYLPEASFKVAEYLQNRKKAGFFMMVEGSQIDWALHANDAAWLRSEMLDFDDAVLKILEFAQKQGETLVIVTGDHECGGLALPPGRRKRDFQTKFSSRLHTGTLVPVFAYGPGAELFAGVYDNTQIYYKILKALGL